MSFVALNIAANSLAIQSEKVQTIASNIANTNVIGYKASTLYPFDSYYNTQKRPGGQVTSDSNVISPTGIQFGTGAYVGAINRNFKQGEPIKSDRNLDIMINGEGFFVVNAADGTQLFTRNGSFKIDAATNQLITQSGLVVSPGLTIDPNIMSERNIFVKRDGRIVFKADTGVEEDIGQLDIATFINNDGLVAIGDSMYIYTDASGDPSIGAALTDNRGAILDNNLESSNVDSITEVTNLTEAMRTNEMTLMAYQTADNMLKSNIELAKT